MWKILIVEDELTTQKLLLSMLDDHGECEMVMNGLEGFKIYSKAYYANEPFNVVLLDLNMSIMDGLQLVELIREFEESHDVPENQRAFVLAVTSAEDKVDEAREKGVDDYLLKPVEKAQLIEIISKAVDET